MHVHLPKPLHGWRAFAGEVGIIVLGVLIALGFEQIVVQWQWRQELGDTRRAIGDEIGISAEQGAERLAIEDCLRQRIGELSAKLNSSNGEWKGDPMPLLPGARLEAHWDNRSMGRVYSVPLRGWSQDAWDAAKSTGALNHMRREEIIGYGAFYAEVAAMREWQTQELPLESKLAFLSVDQRLDNNSRTEALATLGQLDALNAVVAGLSSLMLNQIKGLHLQVDRASVSKQLDESVRTEREDRGACVKNMQIQF
jgi:hypothetical protein